MAFTGVSVSQLTCLVVRQPLGWLGLVSFSSDGVEARLYHQDSSVQVLSQLEAHKRVKRGKRETTE